MNDTDICYTDTLTTLAKGTDAGLYRLIPEKVEVVKNEEDVKRVLAEARKTRKPLTFKAGGTSLSGQTVTDSVLVEISPDFGKPRISADGHFATFPCSMTGGQANRMLKRYGRRLGPAPASIESARIGGIVANNASGAGFGRIYNSYYTIVSMRVIFADGAVLDTGSAFSRQIFLDTHTSLLEKLMNFRMEVICDPEMMEKILHKYELKNTCGYGLNSLLDYEDPYDILIHLMVGSEGTLGFISEVTFETVPDPDRKAAALVYFPDRRQACRAIGSLRDCEVSAAELMDREALRAVQDRPGMPERLRELPDEAVALLIDTAAYDAEELDRQCERIREALAPIPTLDPVTFTTDPETYAAYWRVRSGLFTSAAAARPRGTVSIIEDIAFRAEALEAALADVRATLNAFGYADAVMWGHLLDGNVHFTLFPDINRPEGVENYAAFMRKLVEVVLRHDGSLKAEHGTGRNMAPFVRQEWGDKLYHLMRDIKRAFDPKNLLNPGVILNRDPEIFIKNLKKMPLADERIDRCIECGFCERACPSGNLTLTPRQRIVAYRAMAGLKAEGKQFSSRYRQLKQAFRYAGEATCAADGLCGVACPVGISTGDLVKDLRRQEKGRGSRLAASWVAGRLGWTSAVLRVCLSAVQGMARRIGYERMETLCEKAYRWSGRRLPLWTRFTPAGARRLAFRSDSPRPGQPEMVYFPACITRTMGPSADYKEQVGVTEKTVELLHRAGFAIRYPEKISQLCCGMAFSSKGFARQAASKADELNRALLKASDDGRLPVLCDMSPCLLHMRETLDKRLRLYEPVEFISRFLADKLTFRRLPLTVAVHSTCSTTKMGLSNLLTELAGRCAERVVVPPDVSCCGWAGDRGFFYPELNASALRLLKTQTEGAEEGYSNSRTCEIGLTMQSGISYKSIVFLVDRATREG